MSEETKLILEELNKLNGRMDKLDGRMDKLDERMDKLDERMDKLNERMDKLDERMDKLDERIDKLDNNIKDIRLTLENETNKNIQIIAENHLDLSRKLDEALKVENEKEMLLIRVNRLENEVRRLKEKLDEIA